jgi:hypothetical protein
MEMPMFALLAAFTLQTIFVFPLDNLPTQEKLDGAMLEKLAKELPYFSANEFGFGRIESRAKEEKNSKAYSAVMEKLTSPYWKAEDVRPHLKHQDAKVRVLAAAVLFDMEDPKELPHIATLWDDKAPAFPGGPGYFHQPGGLNFPAKEPKDDLGKAETVSDIVQTLLKFPMEVQYNRYENFDAYWQSRKNLPHFAGWYLFRLKRATQGVQPLQRGTEVKLARLLRDVQALPVGYRDWIFLMIANCFDQSGDAHKDGFTREYLILQAGNRLGRAKLLDALQGKLPPGDPDFQGGHKPTFLRVLLHRPTVFFAKEDAVLIESLGKTQGDAPIYPIAAAKLDPARAETILKTAIERFTQKKATGWDTASLAAALFEHDPAKHEKYLLDWFYKYDPLTDRGSAPSAQQSFIREVGKHFAGRRFFTAMVEHAEFDTLTWQGLEELVEVVNDWQPKPIIDNRGKLKAMHPRGQLHYLDNFDANAPEGRELLRVLAEWRRLIREAKPGWLKN